MDFGGLNWFAVEVIGAIILLGVLLWAVIRAGKRRSGEASVESSERATRDLYAEEERRSQAGTDSKPE